MPAASAARLSRMRRADLIASIRGSEGLQHVAEAAHRADADARRLELGAKARDVDLDRIRRQVVVPARDVMDDAFLGNDFLGFLQQYLEYRPFACGQLQPLAREVGAPRRAIH